MKTLWPALIAPVALAACSGERALSVDQAWVRLPAVPGRPAAAYFTIHGGAQARVLTGASTSAAEAAELHESMDEGGMAAMRPLRTLAVPAGGTVAFAPGGRHVMLFGLDPTLRPGATVLLTLVFADGTRVEAPASVVAPGDPAPY